MVDERKAQRVAFLAGLKPGDLVSWITFDGSSVCVVHSVTDDEIVLCRDDGSPGAIFPRSGVIHRLHYGGFDDILSAPTPTALEYHLRSRHRASLDASVRGMDARGLEQVAGFAAEVAAGTARRSLSADELRLVADLLDAGERAFRALERITGRPAPLSGGTRVQDDIRAMADDLAPPGTSHATGTS